MNVHDRQAMCEQIDKDKRVLALSLARVQRIDNCLQEDWGIGLPAHPDKLVDVLMDAAGTRLTEKYVELHDERLAYLEHDQDVPTKLDTAFYDLIADARISGHIHSQKRTEILDATCLLIRLVEAFQITGPVLDVGCHTGYVASILANETGLPVHGIDLATKAIRTAQERFNGADGLSFGCESLSSPALTDRFEMIYAMRSVEPTIENARDVVRCLKLGGIAVWFCSGAPEYETLLEFRDVGLGYGFGDVVGGYVGDGRGYEGNGVFVFVRGGSAQAPVSFCDDADTVWSKYFHHYANAPDTKSAEKTQAYARSRWLAEKAPHRVDVGPALGG